MSTEQSLYPKTKSCGCVKFVGGRKRRRTRRKRRKHHKKRKTHHRHKSHKKHKRHKRPIDINDNFPRGKSTL